MTFFSAFGNVNGHRCVCRIFLLWCSFFYDILKSILSYFIFIKCTNVVMHSLLQPDPPTNTAIGRSPARKRAATSKNPTTYRPTLPSDVISHYLIHHLDNAARSAETRWMEKWYTCHQSFNWRTALDDDDDLFFTTLFTWEKVICWASAVVTSGVAKIRRNNSILGSYRPTASDEQCCEAWSAV